MPEVKICKFCGKKIDEEKEEYGQVPGTKGELGHAKCIEEHWKSIADMGRRQRPIGVTRGFDQ